MAFVSKFSLYKFTVLPFCLYNALSTFQHLINYIFSDIIDQCLLVYLDNILVYSKTTNDHEKYLHEVFSQLHTHKLQIKYVKCEFGYA